MASPIYGTAFLNIQPDLRGFGTSLTRGVAASTGVAGNQAGAGFGAAFLKGVAAIGIGRLIVGQITGSIDESLKFESAFAGVLKTVEGTVTQLDQMRTGIIEMSKVLPASREEIAGVAEAAGQLGIQTEAILDFTKVMIDLGETTDLTADQAATAFAQIANVMSTPQTAFENMASALVELGNKGASTESQIIDFAQRIAGAGEIAGLAESDVLAIGSAMASVGIEAEAGGTAVQKVLLGITEAVATTNDDLEIFAETAGLSATEFAKAWGEDAAGAFTLFVEGLARAGDGAFQILEKLDLQDQRLIRSFLSLSGAGDLLRTQIEIGTTAWDDNTAATEEANKRYETAAARLEVVKNRATELQRQFGDRLVPIIVDLAEQHLPALENAFADVTTSMPGEADAQDFINFLSDVPRGIGVMTDLVKAQVGTFTGIVEGFSSVLTGDLVGDTDSAIARITGAWQDFGQNALIRDATQAMIQELREGEDSAVALTTALERIGRRGKIDPKVVRTLSQIADVDPSQLVLELERLVELGPELGLGADDITSVKNALIDLGPPSIEAVRQANLLARGGAEVGEAFRGVPANLKPAESAFTDLFLAAAEAELTFSELVDPANDAGAAIFGVLDPTDQLILKLQLLNDGLISAADAFSADLRPTLIDVQEGLQDLNKNGQVSLAEFSLSLETAARDFLDFMVDIAAIAAAGAPELAAAVEALGEDAGGDIADLLSKADDDEVLSIAEKLLGSPEQLGKAFQEIYQEGLEAVDGADAAAIAAWLGFVADTFEEDLPGITAIMVEAFQPSLDAAINSLRPPDLNPILKAAIAEIRLTDSATAFQRVFDFLTNALDIDLSQPGLDAGRTYFGGILEAVESREAELLEATNIDLTESGRYSGRTYMGGMLETIESRERDLRTTISGTLNRAIYADSPPKLFLDAGDASGVAFWSGFTNVRQVSVDPPTTTDFGSAGQSAGESFTQGFTEEVRRFEGEFRLGPGFDPLTADQILALNLDPNTQVFTGFDPLTVGQLEELMTAEFERLAGATEFQFDFDLQALQEQLGDLAEVGAEARDAFMVGLSTLSTEEITRLRASILDTVNEAIEAGSPSKLFLRVGKGAGESFWSGVTNQTPSDFGVGGQQLIKRLQHTAGAVSFGGEGGGGITIGSFSVSNPIGEPTEESVQSALLEVAISPVVNRLVSAGSSL